MNIPKVAEQRATHYLKLAQQVGVLQSLESGHMPEWELPNSVYTTLATVVGAAFQQIPVTTAITGLAVTLEIAYRLGKRDARLELLGRAEVQGGE